MNSSPAVPANGSQQVTQTYFVSVKDSDGDVSTKTVTIKLVGKNDGPTAIADTNASDAVVEQGTATAGDMTATGNVNDRSPSVRSTSNSPTTLVSVTVVALDRGCARRWASHASDASR